MADDAYLTNTNQPPAAIAPLGTGGLAALAGGQLAVVPALPETDSNWYFDLFGPAYDDYYDWSPGPSNQPDPPAATPASGPVAITVGVVPTGSGSAPAPSSGSPAPAPSSGSGSGAVSAAPLTPITPAPSVPAPSVPAPSGSGAVSAAPLTPAAPMVPAPSAPAPLPEAQPVAAPAPSPSPVTVVIAPYPMPSIGAAPSSAPAPGAPVPAPVSSAPASATPVPQPIAEEDQLPSAPVEKTLTAVAYNPRFRESRSRGQDALLQELLDEEGLTIRMHTKESAPLAFVVPDGCDSVEFSYGAIEANPELGCDNDLAQVVTVGEAQLQGEDGKRSAIESGSLVAGAPLLVTLPWRAASHVNLNANHLIVTVHARFYAEAEPSIDDERDFFS